MESVNIIQNEPFLKNLCNQTKIKAIKM